jgi:hypothetical protein
MRVARALTIIPSLLLPVLAHTAQGQELTRGSDGWSRYVNARFGTTAEVPTNLFKVAGPPPANGDGRQFKADDGAELRIFGSYSAATVTESFAEYKAWFLAQLQKDGLRVSYKPEGKDWLVASGSKGSGIVYIKVVEGCDATHEMRIEYPSASRSTYDPIIGRLARSLRCKQPE